MPSDGGTGAGGRASAIVGHLALDVVQRGLIDPLVVLAGIVTLAGLELLKEAPAGRLRLAGHFSAGICGGRFGPLSPVGTAECARRFIRPYGTDWPQGPRCPGDQSPGYSQPVPTGRQRFRNWAF